MKAGTILWPTRIWAIGHEAHVATLVPNAAPTGASTSGRRHSCIAWPPSKGIEIRTKSDGFATKSQVPISSATK